jgi:cyanophycin synthetase
MEILETHIYRGANYWAPGPAIRFVLDAADLTESHTNMIPGFCEKLSTTLPTLGEHRCAIKEPGGFFERVQQGTSLLHVAEHVALELQILAGQKVSCGEIHAADDPEAAALLGVSHLVFQ